MAIERYTFFIASTIWTGADTDDFAGRFLNFKTPR